MVCYRPASCWPPSCGRTVAHPQTGINAEIDAAAKALGDGALRSAKQYVDSRRLQPDHEAHIAGVTAAFGI